MRIRWWGPMIVLSWWGIIGVLDTGVFQEWRVSEIFDDGMIGGYDRHDELWLWAYFLLLDSHLCL